MDGVEPGQPPTWDGGGGVRPEQVARRKRMAVWATVVALGVAVPTVVGSSAGWWSTEAAGVGVGELAGGGGGAAGGASAIAGAGDASGVGAAGDGVGVVDLVVDLDGGLLDAGFEPGSGCEVGPAGDPIRIGVVVDRRSIVADGASGDGGPGDTGSGGSGSGDARAGGDVAGDGMAVGAAGEQALEVAAARHLVALANCAGGVRGRPVEVVVAEAAGSALATSDAVEGLLQEEVAVIIGPPAVEVALQVAEASGVVPVVVPWSVEPALDDHDRGLFLIDPDVTALAEAAARLVGDRGWRRVVLFTGSSPLDDLAAVAFSRALGSGADGRVVELPLLVGAGGVVEVEEQLDRLGVGALSSSPPDAVVTTAGAEQAAQLAAALEGVGVEVPVVAIDRREPRGGREVVVAGMEIVGRPLSDAGGRSSRFASALEAGGVDGGVGGVGVDAGGGAAESEGAGASADPLGPSVDAAAAARVADAILVALDALDRAGTADPAMVADELRSGGTIDGVAGPTGVWPGRDAGSGVVRIPVLGSGPGGPVLVASLELVGAGE